MRKSLGFFSLSLLLAGLAVVGGGSADAHPSAHGISIDDKSAPEGDGGGQTPAATMTISMTGALVGDEKVTVNWATSAIDETATPTTDADVVYPADYKFSSGTAEFTVADSTETISIPVLRDDVGEGPETFRVNLFSATASCEGDPVCLAAGTPAVTITDNRGIYTITDDDVPSFNIDEITAPTPLSSRPEGADSPSATTDFSFTVTRTGPTVLPTSVNFATADGNTGNTATVADNDYVATSGTLDFPDSLNATESQTVVVQVNDDTKLENNETFRVLLSRPTGEYATVSSDSTGVGTIENDDLPPNPTASISDATAVTEGEALAFTISLSAPPDLDESATVNYSTNPPGGTATSGSDYPVQSGSVTFGPGETEIPISINTTQDTIDEPSETMTVTLTKPVVCCTDYDYDIGDGTGVGTITDDDVAERTHDFNGDGFADEAFGVPGENFDGKADAGLVNVIYGAASGLSPSASVPDQVWHLDVEGVEGVAASDGRYGAALAYGDFNNDGFDDLAVGAPGAAGAGAVSVLFGSASGLTITGDQFLDQEAIGGGVSEAGDAFGEAVATGDVNGDAFTDLIIGSPGEALGGSGDGTGLVHVLFGEAGGLSTSNTQLWHQDSTDIGDTGETGDRFGAALASGDLNGDGISDLVIGAPGEDVGTVVDAGNAHALHGSITGLVALGSQIWDQETLEDAPETGDAFAASLAVGDFDDDGAADAAFGVGKEDVGADVDAGAVNVALGLEGTGLVVTDDLFFTQDDPVIEGSSEPGDLFGYSLDAGDLNGDGKADLAVGAPGESIGSKTNGGGVSVLYGSATGPATAGSQFWSLDSAGINSSVKSGDLFGFTLGSADFNDDGWDDLVVGVPSKDVSRKPNAGAASVINGSASGLVSTDDKMWHQNTSGVNGAAEKNDFFGSAVG